MWIFITLVPGESVSLSDVNSVVSHVSKIAVTLSRGRQLVITEIDLSLYLCSNTLHFANSFEASCIVVG